MTRRGPRGYRGEADPHPAPTPRSQERYQAGRPKEGAGAQQGHRGPQEQGEERGLRRHEARELDAEAERLLDTEEREREVANGVRRDDELRSEEPVG